MKIKPKRTRSTDALDALIWSVLFILPLFVAGLVFYPSATWEKAWIWPLAFLIRFVSRFYTERQKTAKQNRPNMA
ncbi:MAG: hypothetical protein HYZ25_06235 [Chloroflexi bacterium]|nr:hypothetical protein [Chloroflexota bacterium]